MLLAPLLDALHALQPRGADANAQAAAMNAAERAPDGVLASSGGRGDGGQDGAVDGDAGFAAMAAGVVGALCRWPCAEAVPALCRLRLEHVTAACQHGGFSQGPVGVDPRCY